MPSSASAGCTSSRKQRACRSASSRVRSASVRQHLARRQPVGRRHLQAHVGAALQPGDAHHVELVEVAGEDGEELHPLQQRLPAVLGQREHPLVEGEPGQLAVAEPVVGQVGGLVGVGGEVALGTKSVG